MTIILAMVLACPAMAEDQPTVKPFDPYVALFLGGAIPDNTDVKVTGPNDNFTVHGVELNSSLSWGGKVGTWITKTRERMGIDLGLELDITNYYPTQAGRKRYAATGTSGGATVVGATTSQLNFNSTLVAMNVLTRLPLMVSQEFPNGRISPYFGGGVGFDRTYYRATRLEGTEYDVAYQAKVGAEIFFIKNLSVLGEYKFTATEHTFKDSRGDNDYNFNVNHFVGGVAMHF